MMHGKSVALKSSAQADLVRTIVDVTADIPKATFDKPAEVLTVLLERLAARLLPISNPLASAQVRGALAQQRLLNEGGALSSREVGKLLGNISRQAVDKRRADGKLLALELPKRGYLYPAWQFTERGPLQGLAEVLSVLREHDPWAQARFFITSNKRLRGERPLDRLQRGEIEPVLRAATMFGEHGAA